MLTTLGGIEWQIFCLCSGLDDNQKATRCFQFAKIAAEKGHAV